MSERVRGGQARNQPSGGPDDDLDVPGGLTVPDPVDVLKWSAVVFIACLEVLVLVAIVLAMFGVF
jgi:hypothetical protein